ncbi:MAG: hypothetical protein AAFR47_02245 [Pseudomonadota bacterium]
MAYSTANPPVKVASGVGSGGPSLWIYNSADVHTDVDAADYFTNGDALGMKVNDHVQVAQTVSPFGVTLHLVTAVTSGGAATVGSALLS